MLKNAFLNGWIKCVDAHREVVTLAMPRMVVVGTSVITVYIPRNFW